jgi:uncharacterized protein (UPF0276 family)
MRAWQVWRREARCKRLRRCERRRCGSRGERGDPRGERGLRAERGSRQAERGPRAERGSRQAERGPCDERSRPENGRSSGPGWRQEARVWRSAARLRTGELRLTAPLAGVGLGLRWELLDEVLAADSETLAPLAFFEVSPENYMRRGGSVPRALADIAARRAIVTHGLMMSIGGIDPFDDAYFRDLRAFVDRFGGAAARGAWHSDHLCFSSHGGVALHDLLPLPFDRPTARRVAARVREASQRLERTIAVENVSYYLEPGRGGWTEAEFLAEVVEASDCRILLDLNNLDVNAHNHGIDPLAWLDAIPLERVVEIHVAGPEPWDASGLLVDTHGAPVRPSVHALLEHVVERAGPRPVLLERDHHVPPLAVLLDEVRTLAATVERATARRLARGVDHA